MRDEEKLAKLNAIAEKLEKSIDKLIEYEAMKCANEERRSRGESLAYNEEAFMKLLEK
jgi:hypothetical protein